MKARDLTGQTFGNFKVIEYYGRDAKEGRVRWLCRCLLCSKTSAVRSDALKRSLRSGRCQCAFRDELYRIDDRRARIAYEYRQYQYAAKSRNRGFYLLPEDFESLITANCHYCGAPPSRLAGNTTYKNKTTVLVNGIDRLRNEEGYTTANSVPCCTKCNMMKGRFDAYEFLGTCLAVYEHRLSPTREMK